MTLRFTDEETEALREQAKAEGRSMQEVARTAIREYLHLDTHRSRVVASAAAGAERYADALRRLGQ